MFGDLFEEDFSFLSNNHCGKGKKAKPRDSEPPAPRDFTNLSGIKNQGGTCYLNSLLQTLLFTPEFREALFALGPEELGTLDDSSKPDAKVRIIPLQLQRLFAQLLLLDQQAASTTDLTESFGWNSHEEMRQHDVQELNRILFSALETSLVGTSGHDLINRLYHGIVVNQIVCKECKNISERQEDFLDLTVAVKGVTGLEEALWNMYVEEEYFENENLYQCGACDKLVEASKLFKIILQSAKLRKLPPFLTISLLRFNFDFEKCERYKETSCYTFPIQINLRPFCEQTEMDDSEYMYELFSVIIHKGGCYGGHYHVYIRDVDELGNWQLQEEEDRLIEDKPLRVTENAKEIENPLAVLKGILSEEESKQIPVDQLGQKLLEKYGVSWNKKYRKQCGALRKYLQNHPQIFQFSPDENKVGLKEKHKLLFKSDSQGQTLQSPLQKNVQWNSEKNPTGPRDNSAGCHWFDLNDSKVHPIKEKDIEKQFQGKESAYMLFYRKSQLKRPAEARGNPRYQIPEHLLNEMNAANTELQKKRAECDSANNGIDLHLHLSSCYKFHNGALHPSLTWRESVVDLTIDRRKMLGDLRQSVFQMLESWEGDMILSIARPLPAGLHLYQILDGDELTLDGIGLADGADIFVWNGKEVGGTKVMTGPDHEPVVINVLRLAEHNEGGKGQHFTESQHVFSCSTRLGDLRRALAPSGGIILKNGSGPDKEAKNWEVFLEEDMKETVKSVGLTDGCSVLILDSHDQSFVDVSGGNLTAFTYDISWLQVKNFCRTDDEEKRVKITATIETVMSDIKMKAIRELQLEEELANDSCLRPVNGNGKLLSPVPEDYTVKEAELKMGSLLGLCHGKAPTSTQLFLYFIVGSDQNTSPEMEIIVEETASVKECLNLMLEKSGLSDVCFCVLVGDNWHLRRIDWCYEAGEALSQENATLKELNVCRGDTLVITEGKLPPKGFLKIPIWWLKSSSHMKRGENAQDQVNGMTCKMDALQVSPAGDSPEYIHTDMDLCYAGSIEIAGEASLEDLKMQAMTLPYCQEQIVPLPSFLRAWTLESKHPGKLLRNNKQQLNDYKLGSRVEICIEALQKEENLGPHELLLRVQMGIPGERDYYDSTDLVWDISKECTTWALRQRVASHYCLPVDKIEIAKYFPEKFEWLPISSWTQQISKRKRKKKQESLQLAPYHLKDGDIIGVKNLLLDDTKDFSTVRDDVGKEKQRQLALEKKKSRQAERLQDHVFSDEKLIKHRKPEVALSINVGVFR
ncbi:ubiquitin carboxyl-terminal hydrolase 40 isoform X1 [Rissa tridactyla]|uniref:ubiquitin carboxyl-terminal hydrolase 40 isoform X1 n=2 Tax=Rissa tridactyla TaxID=75485 RepID=UPI0023BA6E68|nr:ubiquitin carboxyl-terminal hydrolase 40 isoform X1 [Rissa tridactyla]XP_054064648.1 ubiquitin carboxyl-terminal hydrolase 40 isoform X1 [Rissa tridactyla]XP_054064649.1 ubiquitin carboxyl-terminal hydrolase 40 isoform X1 [Rissa tridactyla]XP_054064650.1 ubiquitin carboxyl-terminal hydrolase 40 isoform X1 [Rissa tridactyla]XP_054064651.1 ubiquitin carboxyl-terminal hydrolase 40 isoform X1 [Rissa tridactyla]XP_054064659.1 ubiquitin carboxyl-terminal hydrolase 40 isoform X1 [Rissa tridactyla]